MRYFAAIALLSLIFVASASAQQPKRVYMGRSVVILPNAGAYAAGLGYNYYPHGADCLRFGYPPNCAYYELPTWNGPMEIRNPGGG